MTDKFSQFSESLSSPPTHVMAVTPDDDAVLAVASRCLNVAEAGTVHIETINGDVATVFVAAGVVFPIRVQRIFSAGTTASSIVVMY